MNDIQAQFNALLGKLENVQKQHGGEYLARCPVCDEPGQRHLYTRIGDQDRIVLHCQHKRGCENAQIMQALGLRMSDLFEQSEPQTPKRPQRKQAARVVSTYDYHDEQGAILHQTVRYEPKNFKQRRPDGKGGWTWSLKGARTVLYHLPEVLAAEPGQAVFLCEGEKNADAIRGLGAIATTNPMGAGSWDEGYTKLLIGKSVVILPDLDNAGRQHALDVAKAIYGTAESVRILEMPDLKFKDTHGDDPFDWVQRGGELGTLCELAARLEPYGPKAATWDDMAARIGPIVWDWPGWLAQGVLTIVAGEPSKGKSALALRCAGCYVRGDAWPDGTEYNGEHGRVLWCEAEAAQAINLERAKAWGYPLDKLLTPLADPLQDIRLDIPEHQAAVQSLAHRPDVRLIVVDSLRGAQKGDENSSESADLVS